MSFSQRDWRKDLSMYRRWSPAFGTATSCASPISPPCPACHAASQNRASHRVPRPITEKVFSLTAFHITVGFWPEAFQASMIAWGGRSARVERINPTSASAASAPLRGMADSWKPACASTQALTPAISSALRKSSMRVS